MRTKALLGLAALAAGAMTAAAQSSVYSLNVVGYYNVTVPANSYALVANQLNTTNNTLSSLIPNPPPGTTVYKYNGGYVGYLFDELDLVWTPDGNATLNPGEGALIKNVTASPMTLTFVGEVLQGNMTNAIPNGFSVRSSMVPQAGTVSALGFPPAAGDTIYKYNNGYTGYLFDELDLVWTPNEPSLNVGEAVLIKKIGGTNWVRNFTVQ